MLTAGQPTALSAARTPIIDRTIDPLHAQRPPVTAPYRPTLAHMPSMLTLPPCAADLGFDQYPRSYDSCRGATQGMLYVSDKETKDSFGGGLPTPPTTVNMAALSVPYGSYSYHTHGNGAARSHEYKTQQTQPKQGRSNLPGQEESIAAHLQIPESVNGSKGSLAEFAAEITCLFWFETSAMIEYAENLPTGALPDRGLDPDAIPAIGFTKWVTTILSTTQVGKNVILLALMFIYRLKKFNPSVSGKRGSEFRLLTIALMLGNKFLDDNTYTNKTWAEVSGISVNEIHIMEVEFLSNMRYELYASGAQWQEWKAKLGKFGSFYEKAARFSSPKHSQTTPTMQSMPHKLPSPPTGNRAIHGGYNNLPNPMHTLPQLPRSPVRNTPAMEYPLVRKRSLDTSYDLPPTKRVHSSLSTITNMSPNAFPPNSASTPSPGSTTNLYDPVRVSHLPLPHLLNAATRNGSSFAPISLPGPRAMSTAYPSTAGHVQPVTPVTAGPLTMPQLPAANPSNVSRASSHAGSNQTSPVNMYGASTPTRPGLSPSHFLMNRSSPYRPVRHVNTLLYPPPSNAMHNTIRNIDYQQMHYQPLSKNNNQLHTGPMPSVQADAWQSQVATPEHQIYRPY